MFEQFASAFSRHHVHFLESEVLLRAKASREGFRYFFSFDIVRALIVAGWRRTLRGRASAGCDSCKLPTKNSVAYAQWQNGHPVSDGKKRSTEAKDRR